MATKSNTEIFAILGEWKRLRLEGVTQKQFAEERGLSVRTLRDWEHRFAPKAESPAEMIAKARVMVDELTRFIDALQPPTTVATAVSPAHVPVRHGHQRPDSFNFF